MVCVYDVVDQFGQGGQALDDGQKGSGGHVSCNDDSTVSLGSKMHWMQSSVPPGGSRYVVVYARRVALLRIVGRGIAGASGAGKRFHVVDTFDQAVALDGYALFHCGEK